jgi:hypothetical protein
VTAGYSGTPLERKLGIKAESRVRIVNPPDGFTLDAGRPARGRADVIVFFTRSRRELERRFAALARAIEPNGGLWVAWPKRSSGVATDLDENVVRDVALAAGLVDNKVCAIDEVWSGLRLVYRLRDRP